MNWIVHECNETRDDKHGRHTAWTKAREDVDAILTAAGLTPLEVAAPQKEREKAGKLKKLWYHKIVKDCWDKAIRQVQPGDTVFFQFPALNHTFFLSGVLQTLKKRGVQTTALIHDLEYLRYVRRSDVKASMRWRIEREEVSGLRLFDKIIVHNPSMYTFMQQNLGFSAEKLEILGIFDYLVTEVESGAAQPLIGCRNGQPRLPTDGPKRVIIAGNLFPEKAGYAYHLPRDTIFEVYGPNYSAELTENIHYHGSFPPAELPFVLEGEFGLVWDGDAAETCSGVWGEYLQYNNPHKTSLYLASGLPVIVWSRAALAEFVKTQQVGLTVDSLHDLNRALEAVTPEDYAAMAANARALSAKLRSGWFTRRAAGLLPAERMGENA